MNEIVISEQNIQNRIYTIRGMQVMLDRDLAELYGVETKVLNQAVKRNSDRFPDDFRLQLNDYETNELVTNCDRLKTLKHSSSNPYVFTEQGVSMLAAVLKSKMVVDESVLTLFGKNPNLAFRIYTQKISRQLKLDIEKYNAQYKNLQVVQLKTSHDRFVIIDDAQLYHIGASLKDLGKKWFAFSKIEDTAVLGEIQKNLAGVGYEV